MQSVQARSDPAQASIQAGGKTQEMNSGQPSQEIIGPRIISEDDHGLVVEFTSPAYEIVEDRDDSGICQTIQSESLVDLAEPGQPKLPVGSAWIGIPGDGDLTFEILQAEAVEIDGRFSICPGAEPVVDRAASAENALLGYRATKDPDIYASGSIHPGDGFRFWSNRIYPQPKNSGITFLPVPI